MKRDVLLIAHFCSDFDGNGNNRFNYLANLFANNNFNVELLTSDFSHNKKIKREKVMLKDLDYKVTFVEEPIYRKNVSLKRFYSHNAMAKNLKKYLDTRKKPSVIYCSIPSLDIAATAAKYAKENNIRFIIDVQDLWPEAFKMIFNIPIISSIIFHPMKKKADYVYKSADGIVAVSETYLNRVLEVNNKVEEGKVVFLGTHLRKFDNALIKNRFKNKPENEIWIAYVGTLGHSYDLTSVFDALEILKNKDIKNLKFIVMGDGPLKEKFELYAKEKQIDTLFRGRLPYNDMVGLLGVCDIAVNPISKGAAGSIINKHGDYAAAGLPVVNTQECKEYRELLKKHQAGINCNVEDSQDLAKNILLLIENPKMRKTMGINSRLLAQERFDRKETYIKIIDLL